MKNFECFLTRNGQGIPPTFFDVNVVQKGDERVTIEYIICLFVWVRSLRYLISLVCYQPMVWMVQYREYKTKDYIHIFLTLFHQNNIKVMNTYQKLKNVFVCVKCCVLILVQLKVMVFILNPVYLFSVLYESITRINNFFNTALRRIYTTKNSLNQCGSSHAEGYGPPGG